ncbi:hypothetical protein EP073_04500 [Geovibrio thiophilus]|uniref:Uncharacterized protein n=1 Tax=Geovibrio thiophilus TaxID=139438 RepID=A0A3R5UY73_9BACT|nr:hypothetical protein [Geovibrio thiophilus]QAR32693.1 hypothetical protein EP073_04500 [Geovibrio thiophilus]
METIESLKKKLTSESQEVLTLCGEFLDQRIEKERLRGESAENRANIILTASGAASAFLVFFSDKLPDVTSSNNALFTLIYAVSALWLLKSVWYSIKSISSQSRLQIVADNVFEFQKEDRLNAMKMIISSKLWELQNSIQPNSERLFYVQRAQRALIVFISLLLLEGLALLTKNIAIINQNKCLIIIFILLSVFSFFFGDKLIEKKGIWNYN